MKLFRYSEAPSVRSLLLEKVLWATKVKEIQNTEDPHFDRKEYSKAWVSPSPPEHLKMRIHISSFDHEGMDVHILEPQDIEPKANILFFHGGSYVLPATRPHWRFLVQLVERTGCRVIAPDYPLAPVHGWADAYRVLLSFHSKLLEVVSNNTFLLMGDSAGGGLALGYAMALRDEVKSLPATLILLSPWLDVTMSNPHIEQIDPSDPFLNILALKRAGMAWAKGANPRKPWISPIYGNFSNLPPMHLFIGTKDLLIADSRRFRGLCFAAGANLSFYEFENMIHDWMLLDFKEARVAFKQISEIVSRG
jgi:acetyl esterase/lipase